MYKKLFSPLIFFLVLILIFLFTLNFAQTNTVQEKPSPKNYPPTVVPAKDKMFFSYEQKSVDKINKIITIKLNGPSNIKADAIDLQLDFNNNLEIKEIIDGDSFLSYPRKIIKSNYLLITGVALDQNNQISFAKPKTTFVQIKLQIKNPNKKISLNFNSQESKIFLSGNDITDLRGSFSKINF